MRPLIDELKDWPANLTLQQERDLWIEFCRAVARPRPATIAAEDLRIPGRGRSGVPVRIYRPEGGGTPPVILYMHGGGWILGNLDTNETVAWGLAEGTGCAVVSIDYRLSPEHPYPAAFNDCQDVLVHLALRGARFGLDVQRIAVCGDSAGGNLSAALCLAARDAGGPTIRAQALIYPVLGIDVDNRSYQDNAEAPMLKRSEMIHYLDAYLGTRRRDPDAYAMPLMATNLRDLPPALVHTAEFDPLRDEGKLYADRLTVAGNDVTYRCAARMVHSFIRARFYGTAAKAEFAVICDFLRKHL
jgi:acetyl esterase